MFLSEKLNVYIPFFWTSLVKCCFVGMKGDAIWKMKQKEKNLGDGVFSLLLSHLPGCFTNDYRNQNLVLKQSFSTRHSKKSILTNFLWQLQAPQEITWNFLWFIAKQDRKISVAIIQSVLLRGNIFRPLSYREFLTVCEILYMDDSYICVLQ